jgi:hypothetical protein
MRDPNIFDDERRLLELLVASEDGCPEAHLVRQGFAFDVMVAVVRKRLATVRAERPAGKSATVAWVRITDEGRRLALSERP